MLAASCQLNSLPVLHQLGTCWEKQSCCSRGAARLLPGDAVALLFWACSLSQNLEPRPELDPLVPLLGSGGGAGCPSSPACHGRGLPSANTAETIVFSWTSSLCNRKSHQVTTCALLVLCHNLTYCLSLVEGGYQRFAMHLSKSLCHCRLIRHLITAYYQPLLEQGWPSTVSWRPHSGERRKNNLGQQCQLFSQPTSMDRHFLFQQLTQSLLFRPRLALLAPGANLQSSLSTTAGLRPV